MENEENRLDEPAAGIAGRVTKSTNPVLYYVLKYWYMIVIAVLLGVGAWQNMRINSLDLEVQLEQAKYSNLVVELASCRSQNEQLNEYIKRLSEDSTQLQEQLDTIKKILDKIQRKTDIAVDDILKRPRPKTCEEGVDLLREVDAKYPVGGAQ